MNNEPHSLTMATIDDCIREPERCPIDINIIPNTMGINLCCVENISWTRTKDGQLLRLTIRFIPAEVDENGEAIE